MSGVYAVLVSEMQRMSIVKTDIALIVLNVNRQENKFMMSGSVPDAKI